MMSKSEKCDFNEKKKKKKKLTRAKQTHETNLNFKMDF